MGGLTIETAETLILNEFEHLSGLGGLENNGAILGLGTVGLVWREPIGGTAPELVTCGIIEEEVPVLEVEAEAEGMKISVSCADVGAASYLAICGDEVTALTLRNGEAVGNVWADDDGDCLVIVRAVNSRGNAVSTSVTVAVYVGAARYLVVKDLFPLRAFRPEEELVFMARITDRRSGIGVKKAEISGIYWSCYEVVKNVDGNGRRGIAGKIGRTAGVACLSDSISVMDGWQRDDVGGNFRFVPGENLGDWLGNDGLFDVAFNLVLVSGVEVGFEWSVIVDDGSR